MQNLKSIYFTSFDGTKIYAKQWLSSKIEKRGLIIIAHGLGETADYYDEFSSEAIKYGFDVAIPEARGHGNTAGDVNSPNYLSVSGNPGMDSLHNMARDLFVLTQLMQKGCQQRPVLLLGHSMGSIVGQLYAQMYSNQLFGLILTGLPFIEKVNELINTVNKEIKLRGLKAPSIETFNEMFSGVNTPFEPIKTDLDWITSDDNLIDEMLSLPTTSVLFNNEFYRDFLLAYLETKKLNNIKKSISILLLCGGMDVISQYGKGLKEQYDIFTKNEIKDVSFKIYDNLRHSILRETMRKEVTNDILEWIIKRVDSLNGTC